MDASGHGAIIPLFLVLKLPLGEGFNVDGIVFAANKSQGNNKDK